MIEAHRQEILKILMCGMSEDSEFAGASLVGMVNEEFAAIEPIVDRLVREAKTEAIRDLCNAIKKVAPELVDPLREALRPPLDVFLEFLRKEV